MDHNELGGRIMQVKAWSFLIAMAVCSIIHGVVPGWLTFFCIVSVLLWALFGYKRVFGGWPDVGTFRESGRAFILAMCWPLLPASNH
ncbi:hypothetical protein SAMN03159335_06230 [Burkholderia cepacia]|nr:hypothetical protein SAMN03159335_06230 [Burkholderia cepacia]